MGLVAVLSVAAIPLGALFSVARDRSLRRRPRFELRLAAFIVGVSLPEVIVAGALMTGVLRSQPAGPALLSLFWDLIVLVLAPVFLFYGHDVDPGSGEEGGENGPEPGEDPPSPSPPIGGLPLAHAEQSRLRLRGPRPALGSARQPGRRRGPAREPGRSPCRVPTRVPTRV